MVNPHDEEPAREEEGPSAFEPMADPDAAAGKKPKKVKEKKSDKLGSGRGIETLFRSVYKVHTNLTTLADTKANFLISVNSLIMFLVVVHGMTYLDDKVLLYPVAIVFFSCAGSIIFAVLSARPRISKDQMTQIAASSKGLNLLFFGDFTRLPKDEYIREFTEALRYAPNAYPLMMSDLYEMGKVLNKKFRRLQYAYWFLLYGLPTGMVLFLLLQIKVLTQRV